MNLFIKIVKRFYCLMILFFLEISWKMYFLFFSNYEMKRIICCWKEAFLWLVKKASFVEVLKFIWCRMKCVKGGKKTWRLIRHNFSHQNRAKKCFMLRISHDMLSVEAFPSRTHNTSIHAMIGNTKKSKLSVSSGGVEANSQAGSKLRFKLPDLHTKASHVYFLKRLYDGNKNRYMIMYILSVSCKTFSFLHYTSNHGGRCRLFPSPATFSSVRCLPLWKCLARALAEVGSGPIRNRMTAQRRTKISLKRWKIFHLSKRKKVHTNHIHCYIRFLFKAEKIKKRH